MILQHRVPDGQIATAATILSILFEGVYFLRVFGLRFVCLQCCSYNGQEACVLLFKHALFSFKIEPLYDCAVVVWQVLRRDLFNAFRHMFLNRVILKYL